MRPITYFDRSGFSRIDVLPRSVSPCTSNKTGVTLSLVSFHCIAFERWDSKSRAKRLARFKRSSFIKREPTRRNTVFTTWVQFFSEDLSSWQGIPLGSFQTTADTQKTEGHA